MCQLSTIKLTSGAWTRSAPPGLADLEGCLEGLRPCSFRYISRRCCANLRLTTFLLIVAARREAQGATRAFREPLSHPTVALSPQSPLSVLTPVTHERLRSLRA
jgi:hypothetical protein